MNCTRSHALWGSERIPADRFIDEANGTTCYKATVVVTTTGVESLCDLGLERLSGMPAELMIRTVVRYLVQPLSVLFVRTFREEQGADRVASL